MKQLKMRSINMFYKKTNKEYNKSFLSTFNRSAASDRYEYGILYTLYSDEFNSIQVGSAKDNNVLQRKLSNKKLILLDKKNGKKKEFNLLINTLNEFGIKLSDNLDFKYSNTLIRHLSTLGWPIGGSLYKKRKIKKKLLFA